MRAKSPAGDIWEAACVAVWQVYDPLGWGPKPTEAAAHTYPGARAGGEGPTFWQLLPRALHSAAKPLRLQPRGVLCLARERVCGGSAGQVGVRQGQCPAPRRTTVLAGAKRPV